MDIPQQKYKRIINQYRHPFSNIINEHPIATGKEAELFKFRNLKYIASKEVLSANYPFYNPVYQEFLEEIKINLTDPIPEIKILAVRLARALPFLYRIKLIELCENQFTNSILAQQKRDNTVLLHPYGYEAASDFSEFLLSVFELTTQNEDIYFDVNQRIITIFTRFFESSLHGDKNSLRNGCQVMRNIFWCFGTHIDTRTDTVDNKLISKLISMLIPYSSFVNRQETSILNPNMLTNSYSGRIKNNTKLQNVILRCRQFQARIRARQFYGFCCILSYLPQLDYQIMDILVEQIFQIMENVSECDSYLQCFSCLSALLSQQQEYYTRHNIMKKWFLVLSELSYKKQFLQYYIFLLEVTNKKQLEVPYKLKCSLSMYCLELTKNIQQQYTRFIIYNRSCSNIVQTSRKLYKRNKDCNFLLSIFQYGWFIDRINQENDLFKSQFLTALLHAFTTELEPPTKEEVKDLIDICHRLIDWKCTSKQETHIPTLKFAFDMYLNTLQMACEHLDNSIQANIVELINRCNQPSIYFLFKFKLIATLLQLPWYQQNAKYLQNAKLNFQFIQDEIRVVMMPKNPKPIFLYEYSLTYDGEIESRKEIQYIKIIMNLLLQIQKVHENYAEQIEAIIFDYHKYLNELEAKGDSNKELINCLQTLEADYYFNECQKYFLMSIVSNPLNIKTINHENNLEDVLLYSHYESIELQDQVNIFGPMSPVQLTIKLHSHSSYSSVFIHIKKNQWVQTHSELKLIVSSGIEKKQVPFQSSILEIKVDRIGSLHFQVWKGMENDLLLGSGNYRIMRRLRWKRADHLKIIDGIRAKVYLKQFDANSPSQTYFSCFYGEPIMIHILKNQNEIIVGLSNKEVWNEIREVVFLLAQELANGSAELIQELI